MEHKTVGRSPGGGNRQDQPLNHAICQALVFGKIEVRTVVEVGRLGPPDEVKGGSVAAATDLEFAKRVVEELWPGSRAVLRTGRGSVPSSGTLLLLLPNASRIRVMAPASPRRVAAAALAPNSSPVTARQKVTRASARMLLRCGFGRLAPHRLEIQPAPLPTPSLADALADVLGQPIEMTVGLGTMRVNRKPVIRVLDSTGSRTIAFAKVGLTDYTRTLVEREARALVGLSQSESWSFALPEVIASLTFASNSVLVMSPLTGRGRKGAGNAAHRRALITELSSGFGTLDDPVDGGRFVSSLRGQLTTGPPDPLSRRLVALVDRFESEFGGLSQRLGTWHGDFTPWNMMTAAGRTSIWDWEQFGHDIPIGLDEAHYCVNAVTQRDGFTTSHVLRGLRESTWPHVDAVAARMADAAYLATISTRYVTASQQEGGMAVLPEAQNAIEALGTVLAPGGSVAQR